MTPRLLCTAALALSLAGTVRVHAEQASPAVAAPIVPAETDPKSGFHPMDLIHQVVDYFPDLVDRSLPAFDPSGAYRIYVRPHFGDFLHRDYVRVPVGVKSKVTDNLELNSEVEGYATHGLGDNNDAGYGFSMARVGAKYEFTAGAKENIGFSTGFNYFSPLSHPPRELTDGMRHLQPYVAFTKPLSPRWGLIGFGTVGMDLLGHSNLEPNFGRNQLHTNSMGVALGVGRGWKYFYGSVTGTVLTGALMSDEAKQVYDLKPELTVPLKMISGPRANILLKVTAHATSGPDGQDYGIGSSVRVELKFRNRGNATTAK